MTLFFLWQLVAPTIVPRDEGWQALLAVRRDHVGRQPVPVHRGRVV